jgi:hypothetical protein
METNWVFQEPIDLEHKQYVLLGFLHKIQKDFDKLKLYPNFQYLSLHLANINLLLEKGQYLSLNRLLKDPDDEILISDLIANNIPNINNNEIIEVINICKFSNEKLQDYFNQAKAIWEIANDTISINPVRNIKNVNSNQGIFFIEFSNKKYAYEFLIKQIKKGSNETKCILKKINLNETQTLEESLIMSKNTLIKNIKDSDVFNNLILFETHHNNNFPLKETILPIVKRKIMNYMIQSKIIQKKV